MKSYISSHWDKNLDKSNNKYNPSKKSINSYKTLSNRLKGSNKNI